MVRFVLGGAVTLCTGLIAEHWGPVVGGLFLSFPAIFPATVTLIERHETEKKSKAGINCRSVAGRLRRSMRRVQCSVDGE